MSNLQRNFSFQAHDENPAYHPLDSSGDSPQQGPMAQDSQPLTGDNLARLGDSGSPLSEGHPANSTDRTPHRVPSTSEVSALSTRDEGNRHGVEDGNKYSGVSLNHGQQSTSQRPLPAIAAEGEGEGSANNGGENNVETNDAALLHPKPSENNPRLTPAGGYREDERYWGPELGYAQGNRRSGYFAGEGDQYDGLNSSQRGLVTPGSASSPLYPPSASSPTSQAPLVGGTSAPAPPAHGLGTLENRSSDRVLSTPVGGHYTDNPYNRYSTTWDPVLSSTQVQVDGNADVLSDEEEEVHRRGAAGAAATGAAGGGVLAALGSRVGRPAPSNVFGGAAGAGGGGSGVADRGGLLGGSDGGSANPNGNEKVPQSEWLRSQTKSKKKLRWIIGVVLIIFILGAAGGISAGVVLSKKSSGGSSGSTQEANGGGGSGLSGEEDTKQNGDLNKDSAEIKALMSNVRFKKVFHGMDYTPLGAVYPDCIVNPPTQNNITRDIAVMSQLTDKLRLYGTDCNQTEMVLHAIDMLKVDMKIWLGVWLDKNTTTNTRQLGHLYKLLDTYHSDRFEGIAVGNEVLFRKELSETELFGIIDDVRHNLTSLNIKLPVGTSDLGSNWKSTMVSSVDVLMANVHPFFAGVVVEKAANWTYNFFQDNDVILTTNLATKPRVMISEVGWPSGGGNDSGSVAGISEMNRFMKDFLCVENSRGTEYFWFSAFDEPWKVRYNEPELGKEWEDKWGLMDVNRNLKDGLVIPDCK